MCIESFVLGTLEKFLFLFLRPLPIKVDSGLTGRIKVWQTEILTLYKYV